MRRQFVALPFLCRLAPFALSWLVAGCGSSTSWASKTPSPSVPLPRKLVIMIVETPEFRQLDVGNWSDVTTTTLEYELNNRGIETDVVPLAGEPRLPRLELAFRSLEYGRRNEAEYSTTSRSSRIVVDCALVSPQDEILFVGRVIGTGRHRDEVDPAAKAVAEAIVEELSGG